MQSFSEIVDKIKELKGLEHDYEVAELLNIKPKTIGTNKNRNSIPMKKITAFCHKEGISLNWLLHNEGLMKISNKKEYQDIENSQKDNIIIKEVINDYPEIKISDAVRMCTEVMESGTTYAVALYHNLVHFDRAVKNEQLHNKCQEDLVAVNKALSEMRTRMDEVETTNKKLKDEIKLLLDHSGGSAPIKLTMDHAAPTGTEDKET